MLGMRSKAPNLLLLQALASLQVLGASSNGGEGRKKKRKIRGNLGEKHKGRKENSPPLLFSYSPKEGKNRGERGLNQVL